MSDERWRPLHIRTAGTQAEHDAPVPGVPSWLKQSLIDWLNAHFLFELVSGVRMPNDEVLHRVERNLRVTLSWNAGVVGAHISLLGLCEKNPQLFLDVLDLALRYLGRIGTMTEAIKGLNNMLRESGSAWMVAPDRQALVQRVPDEVAAAARLAIQSWPRAGHHLGEAWRKIFGREPDPSGGYHEAVKAVEVAVCPVIIPKHPKPTLGVAIAALRDAPLGKFATVFEDTVPGIKPLDAIRGLMNLVWTNEVDRHGTDDESVPLHVSPDQAEAALFAAVTLVQWFQRGFVRRV